MTHIWTAVTDDWLPLWEAVRPNWGEYCARHGYHLHVQREFDGSRPFTFEKIRLLRLLMEPNGVTWCLDADVVFTNMSIPVESFIGEWRAWEFMMMTKDVNGLNSGSMILLPSTITSVWLRAVASLYNRASSEQDAMQWLQEGFDPYTRYLLHPSINSIVLDEYPEYAGKYTEADGNWAPGHLLAHFPGMSMEQRLALIPKYLEKVIR